jgi:replication initiation and membrane attachment protein DnaB
MTGKLFRRSDPRDLASLLNKVAGLIKRRGTGPVLQAAKSPPTREELESPFFVAVDLVLADGIVEEDEKRFLEELQKTMQMDEGVATKIVDVVLIKNKV